jgi:hypothetical protein
MNWILYLAAKAAEAANRAQAGANAELRKTLDQTYCLLLRVCVRAGRDTAFAALSTRSLARKQSVRSDTLVGLDGRPGGGAMASFEIQNYCRYTSGVNVMLMSLVMGVAIVRTLGNCGITISL